MKLAAIRKILQSDHFIVIGSKGFLSSTPKMGHDRFWKEAHQMFKLLHKKANKQNKEI